MTSETTLIPPRTGTGGESISSEGVDLFWKRAFWIFAVAHVLVWTAVPSFMHGNVPLDTVEIVVWGSEWQLGYIKHPPLPSWLAGPFRWMGGSYPGPPLYLLSQLFMLVTFWSVWRLANDLLDPPRAFLSVMLLATVSFYTLATMEFNHNVAVLPFFALGILTFHRAVVRGGSGWWIACGAVVALGALCKYTIAFLALPMAVFLLADGTARQRLRTPGPYLALVVAVLLFLPHLVWMVQNDFVTVTYAHQRGEPEGGLLAQVVGPLRFLGSQAAVLIPVGLALVPMLSMRWRMRRVQDRFSSRFLLVTTLGPVALLILIALIMGMRPQTAWGLPFWSTLPLLLLWMFKPKMDRTSVRRTIVICMIIAGGYAGAAVYTAVAAPYVRGKPSRIHFPGQALAAQVTQRWHAAYPDIPFRHVGGEPWLSQNISFYASSRPSVLHGHPSELGVAGVDERACPWTSVSLFKETGGVLVWDARAEGDRLPPGLVEHFPDAEELSPVSLPWQTGADISPVRAGVAIVHPQR